jgi:GNAT superfamily N-acetyltransferase
MERRCFLLGGTANLWASPWSARARTLEIFYLGVDPDAWGSGVGTRLLHSAEDHAREIGRETLELWVINDNERVPSVFTRDRGGSAPKR